MKGCERPMKTLLTEKSIKDLIAQGGHSVCIDENTIVTPAARDAIKYNGLEVTDCTAAPTATATYSACIPAPTPAPAAAPAGGDALSTEMIYNALKKMTEQGLLNDCFEAPAPAEAAPYTAENANGFKLVRGGGIKMEVLELENPADNGKVQYQELTVTVDGVPHTAYPGDCLFIQKGSKVIFSSGNTKAKVFYCTY